MFAAPPMLNLVVLRSHDVERAARFYSAKGLLFLKNRHGNRPERFTSEVDGLVFELYPMGAAGPTAPTRIGFSVDDVDSLIDELVAVGGELVSGPSDSEWGRRAVMKDLDGHTVELVTPPGRDRVVASSETSTGVITETPRASISPADFDRRS